MSNKLKHQRSMRIPIDVISKAEQAALNEDRSINWFLDQWISNGMAAWERKNGKIKVVDPAIRQKHELDQKEAS